MKFIPYLSFEGNAEEAISFYTQALGAEIKNFMRYQDAPSGELPPMPDNYADKILHCSLGILGEMIYISDTFPGSKVTPGNKVEINIDCQTEEELRTTFNKLLIGGQVVMPIETVFWGSIFGTLKDKYGIGWSLNYDLPLEK